MLKNFRFHAFGAGIFYPNAIQQRGNLYFVKGMLPLVYKKENRFEVLSGLDLSRVDQVWGFQLFPGIFCKSVRGGEGDVATMTWHRCNDFAEAMFFNGKRGQLPTRELFRKYKDEKLKNALDKTLAFLRFYGLEADEFMGIAWCREHYDKTRAYYFAFNNGRSGSFEGCYHKGCAIASARLVVTFQQTVEIKKGGLHGLLFRVLK